MGTRCAPRTHIMKLSLIRVLRRASFFGFAAVLASAAACGAADDGADEDWDGSAGQNEDDLAEQLADDRPALLIKDPRTLIELEKRDLSLANVLGVQGASTKDLLRSSMFKTIVDT